MTSPTQHEPARPWKAGLAWLLLLGPFFFASYGLANWAAAQRDEVPSIVFAWEHGIPFLPWMIVPYWSVDLLYGASLLLCRTRAHLRTHVARLLFVQIVAVACFLAFPLRFSFERPPVDAAIGWMFAALESFDRPYNQAPSLHIALLVVLWPVYLRAMPHAGRWLVHAMGILIGISVLATWQHHFIDVPTGAWLGCLAVTAIRADTTGLWMIRRCRDRQRRRLAVRYCIASCLLFAAGLAFGGNGLWLLWPAGSLAYVAAAYFFGNGQAYGKRPDGTLPAAHALLLGPYLLGAWINAKLWTRRHASADEIHPGVFLGSLVRPWPHDDPHRSTVVDVSAEITVAGLQTPRTTLPMLDLLAPTIDELQEAAEVIEDARVRGPVLVACALGFSRSAAASAAWLVHAGVAPSIDDAVMRIRRARPAVVLAPRYIAALHAWERRPRSGVAPSSGQACPDAGGIPAASAH